MVSTPSETYYYIIRLTASAVFRAGPDRRTGRPLRTGRADRRACAHVAVAVALALTDSPCPAPALSTDQRPRFASAPRPTQALSA